MAKELKYFSAYDFWRYWRIENPAYPLNFDEFTEDTKPKDLRTENTGISRSPYQAQLTEVGLEKIKKRCNDDTTKLQGGIDYVIKEEGGDFWVPFPRRKEMERIRHEWILVRNDRPRNPSFHGCPMPRQNAASVERNALLLMAYFHPFTLLENESDDNCPELHALLKGADSWDSAMRKWLQGNVVSAESQRFIQNFLGVTQMRPEMESIAEVHSDNSGCFDLTRALDTKAGTCKENAEANSDTDNDREDKKKSVAAMDLADNIWHEGNSQPHALDQGMEMTEAQMQKLRKAILRSQAEHLKSGSAAVGVCSSVEISSSAETEQIRKWLESLERENIVNAKQHEVIRKVTEATLRQMQSGKDPRYQPFQEQLLWLLHGGPGTGKSHVIKILKEQLFETRCNFVAGRDFQILALQAVNADAINGDTIHHALGLKPFAKS